MRRTSLLAQHIRVRDVHAMGLRHLSRCLALSTRFGQRPGLPWGISLLYRRTQALSNVGLNAGWKWNYPVGRAPAGATTIQSFPGFVFDDDTTRDFRLVTVGPGGVMSQPSPQTQATVSSGALIGARPKWVDSLAALQATDGTFELRWIYDPDQQDAAPDGGFDILHDNGTGIIIETPVANVAYRAGRNHYSWTSGAYAHDLSVQFQVRPKTGGGVTQTISATARATAVTAQDKEPLDFSWEPGGGVIIGEAEEPAVP